MVKDSRGWYRHDLVVLVVAVVLLSTITQTGFGQTLTVTASAGSPLPTPTTVGRPVIAPLSATSSNVPSGSYSYSACPVSAPNWSWSTQDPPPPQMPVVQYAATSGAWGVAPQGS